MISLCCPTRGRPNNMMRFARSAKETAEQQVEIVWRLDDDDPDSIYIADRLELEYIRSVTIIGKRRVLSEYWNECAQVAGGDVLGHMGDDIVFRTPGWDTRISEAFDRWPDRIGFVHGRDGVHDDRLGTHGFVSREWVTALGRMVPPHFAHDYNDTWLTEVADRIGRRVFLPDVVTEHMHPDVGKAPMDQTYIDHAKAGERDNVAVLYPSLAAERASDARKLLAVMA